MEFLKKTTAGLPNWAWGLVVVAGLGIGYFVMRSQSGGGSATTATSAQTDAAGQAVQTAPVDANALTASGAGNGGPQIVVLPLASTAPQGSTSSDGSQGTPTPTPTPTPSPGQTRVRNVQHTLLTIRSKGTSSIASVVAYDKTNPPGVPIRSTPGGVQVGFAGYGSTVTAKGPAISGPNNVKEGSGSNSWWPVENGFISGFDVVGVSQQSSTVQVL